MSEPKVVDHSRVVYSPAEVATYGIEAIRNVQRQTTRGLSLGIPAIRDYFAPLQPGQVCAVIAQTSNYKSGFLHCVERLAAEQLALEERTECLVHVSVEELVEEQSFLFYSRETGIPFDDLARGHIQDWSRLEEARTVISNIPIFRIGDSLARAEYESNLYMSNMIRAIQYMVEEKFDRPLVIGGLFFDYLQAFPFDPEIRLMRSDNQRRLQVREDIYRIRQAAAYFKCPVFVAVQAKQHLEGANGSMRIPGPYDGEESSSIAQRCDRIIQMWMPKTTHLVGSTIDYGEKSFTVDENLIWIKVGKQRGGLPAGRAWKCRIDFQRNMIAPELDGTEFSDWGTS